MDGAPGKGSTSIACAMTARRWSSWRTSSETTGLGLGVHVTINPKDRSIAISSPTGRRTSRRASTGRTSRVIAALKYDWKPTTAICAMGWRNGGTFKISKIYPDATTGKYDYFGTKGQKIEWEMVPMGELFVEEGTIPGRPAHFERRRRHDLAPERAAGPRRSSAYAAASPSSTPKTISTGRLSAIQQGYAGPISRSPGIDNDHWEVEFDRIVLAGPRGRFFARRPFSLHDEQSAREQLLGLRFSDPDPRKWKKIAHIEDPLWRGKYPNPFHMVFSMDSSKLYLSVLHPSPARSGVMVVDTDTWTIKKEIQGIGPDMQTPGDHL